MISFPNKKMKSLGVAIATMTLAGCVNLAPDYQRPEPVTPSAWPSVGNHPAPEVVTAPDVAQLGWQDFFLNERLRRTVATTLAHNRDLQTAALDIEKARAQYRETGAALFPTVDATGQAVFSGGRATSSSRGNKSLSAQLGFASYEIDFFGKLRNQREAALDSLLSSQAARRSTQISLIGQVASDWLTLAADRERLAIARETLTNQKENLKLVQARHDHGIASGSDLANAKSSVAAAAVDVAGYTATVARDRNALNLVAGTTVPVSDLPGKRVPTSPVIEKLPAGIPSSVLQNRPDVIAAEYILRGDTALIGAARAAFFPTISLTAATGWATAGLSGLFTGANQSWNFSPQMGIPIFDGGSRTARLDLAHIQRNIDVAQYEKTIQTAFREVADALATRATIDNQIQAQQRQIDATAQAYKLAMARYHAGAAGYLDALVEQRLLYSARLKEVGLRLAREVNLVTMYKVLGGGGFARSADSRAQSGASGKP